MIEIDRKRFASVTVGGELFILDAETGETLRIGGAGARLWSLLLAGRTPDEAAKAVASATGAPYQKVLEDTVAFVARLQDAGVVRDQRRPDRDRT